MENYPSNVENTIKKHYEELTLNQRRLADFIFHNAFEAALMSTAKLAEHLNISEATVVRFAQSIGYEGYLELRDELQAQMLHVVGSSERVATMVTERKEEGGPLHEVVSQTVLYLNTLLRHVSAEQLSDATERLDRASQVLIFGEGAPGSMCYHAEFWFSRLGLRAKRITQTGRRFYEYIFQDGEEDVALILAFRRPTAEAVALLEVMAECGGESILVTDLFHSKMHNLASQVLLVQRGPMDTFRPLGVVTALVDALILGVMRKRGECAVSSLRKLDDLRQRYKVLYE